MTKTVGATAVERGAAKLLVSRSKLMGSEIPRAALRIADAELEQGFEPESLEASGVPMLTEPESSDPVPRPPSQPAVEEKNKSAQDSQRMAQEAQQRARIRELEDKVERYRQASEDALQQIDWCIGYLHGSGKRGIAKALSRNRAYIRTRLMRRSEQPVPSDHSEEEESLLSRTEGEESVPNQRSEEG